MSLKEPEKATEFDIDIPAQRDYVASENEALDEALVAAIEAADEAGNDYLVDLLTRELGSHYFETR